MQFLRLSSVTSLCQLLIAFARSAATVWRSYQRTSPDRDGWDDPCNDVSVVIVGQRVLERSWSMEADAVAEKDATEETPAPVVKLKVARAKRKGARKKTAGARAGKRERRPTPSFPPVSFATAFPFAEAVQKHGAGQQVRRLTLFEKLERSPESSISRDWITNARKYELTKGSYTADFIELTELGAAATSPDNQPREQLAAKFKLAIDGVPVFKALYEKNKGSRLPSPEILRDSLADVPADQRTQAVDIFLDNAKYLGLLRTIAGAERVVSIEQALEDLRGGAAPTSPDVAAQAGVQKVADKTKKWPSVCFVISPIGSVGNEDRKHADMVLEQLVRRALEKEWEVVRADEITAPGMISAQVIEYVMRSGLVIADLSFHNPNVFYELAIRHLMGLPTVHLIRKGDAIPFDVHGFRTITIDTSDMYELVAQLETYRAEISNHTRQAVAEGAQGENPIRSFAKGFKVTLPS
jgi:hypothetical protein